MNLYDGEKFAFVAGHNVPREYAETQLNKPFVPHPRGGLGTVAATHRSVHIKDIRTQEPFSKAIPPSSRFRIRGRPNDCHCADAEG